jgi:hypothetical protein
VSTAAIQALPATAVNAGHGSTAPAATAIFSLAVVLIRLVLRDIARPFRSAGVNIRRNADQLGRGPAADRHH